MSEKFSFISFNRIYSDISHGITFNDEISIHTSSPFKVDEHWQRWLGSIACDEIEKSNLIFLCKEPSKNPKVLDEEHIVLQRKIFDLYYALLLFGVPMYSNACMLSGSIIDGKVSIREVSNLDRNYVVYEGTPKKLLDTDIENIKIIYNALSYLFSNSIIESELYIRLRHGLTAYFKAIREKENYYRIPQLVRAIEAIILPKTGQTTIQFIHKCKTIVISNPESESYLKEMYDLRSKVEHIHPLLEVYPDVTKEEGVALIDLRVRMLEEIARNSLIRILTTPELLEYFIENQKITEFWSLSDQERESKWGTKINLKRIK